MRKRIEKLLALAGSSNEFEAMAALIKAQELMAKYHISKDELQAKKEDVQEVTLHQYTYTPRKRYWLHSLAALIALNYRCRSFSSVEFGRQTRMTGFVGHREDLEICQIAFKYAVSCIQRGIEEINAEGRRNHAPQRWLTKTTDSYGFGFTVGLAKAYDERQRDASEEYALALQTPSEVDEYVKREDFRQSNKKPDIFVEETAFAKGVADGEKFDLHNKLEGSKKAAIA